MFCINCGSKIQEDAKFCSNCGKRITHGTSSKNKVIGTKTKTIGGKIFGNINEEDIRMANSFLEQHNFGKVFWSFSMAPGQVKGITLTGEVMEKPLPYHFKIDALMPKGAGIFGAIVTYASGWNPEQELNEWTKMNPDKRIRSNRIVTHGGIPTQLYILYTVKKDKVYGYESNKQG